MSAPPAFATARTPGRRTRGAAVAKIARATRTPLMPWQRLVADVATERLADGSWAYTDVIVSVPRQSGKTTLIGPVGIERALTGPGRRCWYTAQTRQDARDSLMDDYAPRFEASPLAAAGRVRRSQGSEGIYLANRSAWRVFAPGEEALHGKANELVATDEWWAFDAVQAAALAQAIVPTFTTTGGQWWKLSTAGTARSVPLAEAIKRGRAAVQAGATTGTAAFVWALPEQHREEVMAGLVAGKHDPTAPALDRALDLLLAAHPANGYTLKPSTLRGALAVMDPAEFLRAYGNVPTATSSTAIDATAWASRLAPSWPRPTGPVALAFEVGLDRVDASIEAAWLDSDGRVRVDVIDHRPGADWVASRVAELRDTWGPAVIACDATGPVIDVADQLERAGVKVERLKSAQYATACAGFLSDVEDDRLRHPGHSALDDAVRNVATRPLGESWAWGRRKSAASIAALVGATVARYALLHAPAPEPKPAFDY